MNLFYFLKNKRGKFTIGLTQMAAIAGVGLVVSMTAFQADKKAAEQEKIRSLSSIESGYNYGGMRQAGRDGLTSINVKDGLNQVATAEERARMEGRGGGDFGLSAADNVGGSLSSALGGRAADTSDTEGLGMGRNAVTMLEGSSGGVSSGGSRANAGDVSRRTTRGSRDSGGADSPQLATASVTRASGSGINASYGGASSGGNAGGNSAAGGRTTGGGSGAEGYHFSGAMPSGSDPLSLSGGNGRSGSTFMAGGRNATTGRGSRSKGTGNDLKDISKRSADAALNRNRAANEGARAFLASATSSGGMNIDSSVGTTQSGSADFAAPEVGRLKGISNWGDQVTEAETKRDKDRSNLFNLMIAAIAITVIALPIIRYLITAAKELTIGAAAAGPMAGAMLAQAASLRLWGWVVTGIVCAAGALVVAHAIRFWTNYGFGWMSGGALGVGVACAAAAVITALTGKAGKSDVYKQSMVNSLKGYGITGATKLADFGWQEIQNSDAKKS